MIRVSVITGVVALSWATPSFSQTVADFVQEVSKVQASNGVANDFFGWSAAIDGNWCLIGAQEKSYTAADSGAVYAFELSAGGTWVERQILIAESIDDSAYFGSAVALSGNDAAIGAANEGKVYIFELSAGGAWVESQQLTPSDLSGANNGRFGTALSMSGDTLFIGAPWDDEFGYRSGSVYVFERNEVGEWIEHQKLYGLFPTTYLSFGASVSVLGDRAIIGEPTETGAVNVSGWLYVYERTEGGLWSVTTSMTPSDSEAGDFFGSYCALVSEDHLLVGAPNNSGAGLSAGSAYAFSRVGPGNWVQTQRLVGSDTSVGDLFGWDIAAFGDRAIIGAWADNGASGLGVGSAYFFERADDGQWLEQKRLAGSDSGAIDQYGRAIAVSADSAVVTALGESSFQGAAHIYGFFDIVNLDFFETGYWDLSHALSEALPNDRLAVRATAFDYDGIINAMSPSLKFIAIEPIVMGSDLMFLPETGTTFMDSPDADDAGYAIEGRLVTPEGGSVLFSSLLLNQGAQFRQNECDLLVNGMFRNAGGVGYLGGEILAVDAETTVEGVNRVVRDTELYADYLNDGATIVHRGVLSIYGNLTNNGTLAGEVDTGPGFTGGDAPENGDGFSIGGSYTIGQNATLSMPDPVWWLRVGGDLDIAINDASRFAMSEATIELSGLATGSVQTLEALSADFGADESGFDPFNFPIGVLSVTSDSTTQLVNNHVNAVDTPCEVLYVNELLVANGGTLITNGCPIYARSATINGTVDDPDAIIIIEEAPGCPGDADGNNVVDGVDLAIVLGAWGSNDAAADVSGDGTVDGVDLAIVLGAWGGCSGGGS